MCELIKNSVVVLGGSICTNYGLQVTKCLVENLATKDVTIVSGLETDISLLALETSLSVGGKTVGFLAGDVRIAQKIKRIAQVTNKLKRAENGSVYAPKDGLELGVRPFLSRDKAMVSKCESVLVIEAVMGSRIFNAVEFALKNNKQIFAVPGSVFSYTSKGANFLLRTGAILVESHQDITTHL